VIFLLLGLERPQDAAEDRRETIRIWVLPTSYTSGAAENPFQTYQLEHPKLMLIIAFGTLPRRGFDNPWPDCRTEQEAEENEKNFTYGVEVGSGSQACIHSERLGCGGSRQVKRDKEMHKEWNDKANACTVVRISC
jgi:hypothetical protein